MASPKPYSSRDAVGASSKIRILVSLVIAARDAWLEPAAILWSLARHLAGPNRQWVDRKALHRFAHENGFWGKPRRNQILREGEGVFWEFKKGNRTGDPLVYLISKERVAMALHKRSGARISPSWAEIPLKLLAQGVARRRGLLLETLIGTTVENKQQAHPQARASIRLKTGVPERTQVRWGKAARTRYVRSRLHLGQAPAGYQVDRKYSDAGVFTQPLWKALPWENPALGIYRRIGNIYIAHFELQGRRFRNPALRKRNSAFMAAGEGGSDVRYALDRVHCMRLRQRGFEARLPFGELRLAKRRRDPQPERTYHAPID